MPLKCALNAKNAKVWIEVIPATNTMHVWRALRKASVLPYLASLRCPLRADYSKHHSLDTFAHRLSYDSNIMYHRYLEHVVPMFSAPVLSS